MCSGVLKKMGVGTIVVFCSTQLYINRELPHPSTSPTYCPDPRVCIGAGDRALWPYNTASFICLNPECFGLRAEPWLCHGNL